MSEETAHTLGTHSAKLEALSSDVTEIKGDIKKLLASHNEFEGSKRTIYTMAAVISGLGGAVVTYGAKLLGK